MRELDVFVDDVLVYRGVLGAGSQGQAFCLQAAQLVVESERHPIYNDVEESCLFIDEGSVVVGSDQRPRTAVLCHQASVFHLFIVRTPMFGPPWPPPRGPRPTCRALYQLYLS